MLLEIRHRLAQTVFQAELRRPAQLFGCPFGVQIDLEGLAGLGRAVVRRLRIAGDGLQVVEDLVDGDALAAAQVVFAAAARRVIARQQQQVGTRAVGHVDVIAHLLAIPVDRHRLALQHLPGENGHHPRLALGILARAVDVGIADDRIIQPVDGLEHVQIQLQRIFAGPVRAERAHRVVFIAGQVDRLAVDRAAAGDMHELAHAKLHAQLEQANARHDVDIRVEKRVSHRLAHVHLRGVMIHRLGPLGLEDLAQLGAADIQLVEFGFGVQVRTAAGREVIHHHHFMARLDQQVNHVRTNKTGPTRNKYLHSLAPFHQSDEEFPFSMRQRRVEAMT